jgi:hypothetical protein
LQSSGGTKQANKGGGGKKKKADDTIDAAKKGTAIASTSAKSVNSYKIPENVFSLRTLSALLKTLLM